MWRPGLAVVITWLVFDRVAAATGSVRGEAGIPVAATVLATLLVLDHVLMRRSWRASLAGLGLGRPSVPGILAATCIGTLLLAFFPLYARATGVRLVVAADAPLLLLGLFAQGGFAEELLFRGYLFGQLRARHPFWRAALLSLIPFAIAHLFLFATLPAAIAAAATLLAAGMSFPLGRLYELGHRTIWPPAIVHFVAQGAIKMVTPSEPDAAMPLGLAWMAVCLVVPWVVFLLPPRPRHGDRDARVGRASSLPSPPP